MSSAPLCFFVILCNYIERLPMNQNRKTKTIAILEILTSMGLIAFWTLFFTVGLAPANPPVCYLAFERSFPLPDMVLAAALLSAGVLLLKRNPAGRMLSLLCAGALIFLGLLDFSFNIRNGIYTSTPADAILSIFINAWCVLFGIAIPMTLRKSAG